MMSGLQFPESPRWHEGRVWFCDWRAGQVIATPGEVTGPDVDRAFQVVVEVDSFPFCIDWLPDGTLLVAAGSDAKLLRLESDRTLATYADLSGLSTKPWNEVTVDGRGNAFVNNIGFDFMSGEPRPGIVAVVTPDGAVREVADGLMFPNGMAITPDDATLIVAESYAGQLSAFDVAADGTLTNRRVWATLPDQAAPDGICLDSEGAVWYADVPNRCCVRVREGGEVVQTVDLDRGCFSCAIGGLYGRTLYMVTQEWAGLGGMNNDARTGELVALEVDVPA
jgi:sugar lactone lactonase YvrE